MQLRKLYPDSHRPDLGRHTLVATTRPSTPNTLASSKACAARPPMNFSPLLRLVGKAALATASMSKYAATALYLAHGDIDKAGGGG